MRQRRVPPGQDLEPSNEEFELELNTLFILVVDTNWASLNWVHSSNRACCAITKKSFIVRQLWPVQCLPPHGMLRRDAIDFFDAVFTEP